MFSSKLTQDQVGSACPGSLPGSHRVAISRVTICPGRYSETDRQSADCHWRYMSRVVAVGGVGFTQSKCEVTVCYCDKIERGPSYSRRFCWQERMTLIRANFVTWAEPTLPACLCLSLGELLWWAGKPVSFTVPFQIPTFEYLSK